MCWDRQLIDIGIVGIERYPGIRSYIGLPIGHDADRDRVQEGIVGPDARGDLLPSRHHARRIELVGALVERPDQVLQRLQLVDDGIDVFLLLRVQVSRLQSGSSSSLARKDVDLVVVDVEVGDDAGGIERV